MYSPAKLLPLLSFAADARVLDKFRRADELAAVRVAPTGIDELDAVLPYGGIPHGKLIEIQSPMMGGKLTLTQHLLANALTEGKRAAFIDLPGQFFPCNLPEERLLVARPRNWRQALRAADVLVASREWAMVVIDLTDHMPAIPPEACSRLARAAKDSEAIVLLLHDHPGRTLGSQVSLRLKLNRKLSRAGRHIEVFVAKNKLSSPGQRVVVPLPPRPLTLRPLASSDRVAVVPQRGTTRRPTTDVPLTLPTLQQSSPKGGPATRPPCVE